MSSNSQKPRTSRTKKAKKSKRSKTLSKTKNNSNNGNGNGSGPPSLFDAFYNALPSLTIAENLGIAVSIGSLIATAVILRQRKNQKLAAKNNPNKLMGKRARPTAGGKPGMHMHPAAAAAAMAASASPSRSAGGGAGGGGGGGRRSLAAQMGAPNLPPHIKEQINKTLLVPVLKNRIATEDVTKLFQRTLTSRKAQQPLIADNFYEQLLTWNPNQLDIPGQSIVVNFLFWYYRNLNMPRNSNMISSEQAQHIRFWANYSLDGKIDWGFYNMKFDYLYSAALISKSIPHMRQFYEWVLSQTFRPPPPENTSRKPNYYLTRFQSACVLGKWADVKRVGHILQDMIAGELSKQSSITAAAASSLTPAGPPPTVNAANAGAAAPATPPPEKVDYFMHYTLRSLEMPTSNPNFAMIYKMIERITAKDFLDEILPPPRFTAMHVYQYRYRNVDEAVTQPINNSFIFTSDKFLDADGFYKLYPMGKSAIIQRVPKTIEVWGSVCQMVSPLHGSAGFLPMTGIWTDTKMFMQTDWTYRQMRTQLVRKQGIFEIERTPFEKEVEISSMMGMKSARVGYIWRGTLTVYLKPIKSENAMNVVRSSMTVGAGGGAKTDGDANGHFVDLSEDPEANCQVYDVELVIASAESNISQKEKEREKRDKEMKERMKNFQMNKGSFSGLSNGAKRMKVREAFANMSAGSSSPSRKEQKNSFAKAFQAQSGGGKNKSNGDNHNGNARSHGMNGFQAHKR